MTPADAIAMLDRQIADHGQTVTLRAPSASRDVLAFVRNYLPSELIGGITVGDTLVVLSPSSLPAPWPLPQIGDKVIIDERLRAVAVVDIVRPKGEIVRINLTVRG